jgi:hypothetical protein
MYEVSIPSTMEWPMKQLLPSRPPIPEQKVRRKIGRAYSSGSSVLYLPQPASTLSRETARK